MVHSLHHSAIIIFPVFLVLYWYHSIVVLWWLLPRVPGTYQYLATGGYEYVASYEECKQGPILGPYVILCYYNACTVGPITEPPLHYLGPIGTWYLVPGTWEVRRYYGWSTGEVWVIGGQKATCMW